MIVHYTFTAEDRALAVRLADGRTKYKRGDGSFTPAGKTPWQVAYEGALGEIAAIYRYGGILNQEFYGSKGDRHRRDFIDSDGYEIEAKADSWRYPRNFCMKLEEDEIFDPKFDQTHYVAVRLTLPKLGAVYPAIHAVRVREFGFWHDWGYGRRWNVSGEQMLNQNNKLPIPKLPVHKPKNEKR